MFKSAAKLLLFRVLPRRLIPFITVAEAILLIRSVRNRSKTKTAVNAPARSRTAAPDASGASSAGHGRA